MAVKKMKANRIVIIALVAFTVYVLISLFMMNQDIQNRQRETADLNDKISDQIALNKELQEIVDNGVVDEDYIVRIAREKLNFVYPDERVFKDMVGN